MERRLSRRRCTRGKYSQLILSERPTGQRLGTREAHDFERGHGGMGANQDSLGLQEIVVVYRRIDRERLKDGELRRMDDLMVRRGLDLVAIRVPPIGQSRGPG